MRNIQQGFARWYNKTYARRGRFWPDRFKSTLLYGEDALLECMQYVDLNPVRAGLVARPEDYAFGAFALREKGDPEQLLDLRHLLSEKTEVEAYSSYKSKVYARGSVQSKGCDAVISDQLVDEQCLSKFDLGSGAEARDHLRFFVDGLVIGAKEKVEEWLLRMQSRGTYRRRKTLSLYLNKALGLLCDSRGVTLRVGDFGYLGVNPKDASGLSFVHARFDQVFEGLT
jgi:putative transposase